MTERVYPKQEYFRPLSSELERTMVLMRDDIPVEHRPDMDRLMPRIRSIYQNKDKVTSWGQVAFDVGRTIGLVGMALKTYKDLTGIFVPKYRTQSSVGWQVVATLVDIGITDLIASIPGPNTYKKYDVAAARPDLFQMAQTGTLNERTVQMVIPTR